VTHSAPEAVRDVQVVRHSADTSANESLAELAAPRSPFPLARFAPDAARADMHKGSRGDSHAPVDPLGNLKVIRRQLDKDTMEGQYNCSHPEVIATPALNKLFEDKREAVLDLLGRVGGAATKVSRIGAVGNLVDFLKHGDVDEVGRRWTALTEINAKLGRQYLQVTHGPGFASTDDLERWVARIGPVVDLSQWPGLPTKRVVKWELVLPKIDPSSLVHPSILTEIKTNGGVSTNPALGLVHAKLQGLFETYPPNTPLPRAALEWGPTPKESIEDNKRSHASKHYIPDGSTMSPDVDEHYTWMIRTGLMISKATVDGFADEPSDPSMYDAKTELVTTIEQARKFFREYLPAHSKVGKKLLSLHQESYWKAVLAAAASMTKITVTAFGDSIMLVGQSDDVFIAGRWLPDAKKFTISSGYINPGAKWAENQQYKLWSLADG
jgi:hypothetical protein